jgi:hypothetical protein
MGGIADNPVSPHYPPNSSDWQAADAYVNTVGICGQRNIRTIIDHKGGTKIRGQAPQLNGQAVQLGRRKVLATQLNRPDAPLQRITHDLCQRPAADLVPVGYQVQSKIGHPRHAAYLTDQAIQRAGGIGI